MGHLGERHGCGVRRIRRRVVDSGSRIDDGYVH
jgi:hypothetical protein